MVTWGQRGASGRYGNDITSCRSVSFEHCPVLCPVKRNMNDVAACVALCLTSDRSEDWSLILVGLLESKFKVTAFVRSRYGCIEIDTDTPRQVEEDTQLLKRKGLYSSSLNSFFPQAIIDLPRTFQVCVTSDSPTSTVKSISDNHFTLVPNIQSISKSCNYDFVLLHRRRRR
jgi:hypothetical protein